MRPNESKNSRKWLNRRPQSLIGATLLFLMVSLVTCVFLLVVFIAAITETVGKMQIRAKDYVHLNMRRVKDILSK